MRKYYYLFIFLLVSCGGGGSSNNDQENSRQNTAPELVGLIDFAIDENTTQVATFTATDAEGDIINYSISGVDASLLSIGQSSGILVFRSAPDYEDPKDSDLDNIYSITVTASDGELSASLGIIISVNDVFEGSGGQNMLLVGNSFFRPYAQRLNELANDAGFMDHTDTLVSRGGYFGTPLGLWNDEDTNSEIKQLLDAGNFDIFGMTGYFNESDPTAGFVEWIDYALESNPNLKIFISIPPIDFPADWQQRAEEMEANNIREVYDAFVNNYTHKEVIDQLRIRYPATEFFSIPTGWATFDLVNQYENNLLLDDINLFGSYDNSIFTDQKGHQGKIVIYTGALVWLNAIYGVNLRTNEFDTGFNTDLHTIAENIADNHDSNYKQ